MDISAIDRMRNGTSGIDNIELIIVDNLATSQCKSGCSAPACV